MGNCPDELVVIGTSLGGLYALQVLLSGLPKNLPLAVAIVQHRHQNSDQNLSIFLQDYCALPLTEVEDKDVILPGRVYLAPADYHLLVETEPSWEQIGGKEQAIIHTFALSTEAPVCCARPSIDLLFESAAQAYKQKVIGVILTGASSDGAEGLAKIKAHGGKVIIQDPSTSESQIMPKSAISKLTQYFSQNSLPIDWILQLSEIAPMIVNLSQKSLNSRGSK
jgi:two-component system chemotaxis response regulator CheB